MGITQTGIAEVGNLNIDDDSPEYWGYLAIGTGDTEFANTQTALVSQHGDRVEAISGRITTTYTNDTMRFTGIFAITSTVTVKEVSVHNALTGGDMLARTVLGTPRELTSGESYTLVYDIPLTAT